VSEQEEHTGFSPEMLVLLSELSRHYDSTLWNVTSIWVAALGGLLVYCIENFDTWLTVLGLLFTVCPMFFATSFRELRQRVHRQLPRELAELHVSRARIRQWDVFCLIFLVLAVSWARLLLINSWELRWSWVALTLIAVLVICWLWKVSRDATRLDT
jgi:hypothetical protein